MYDVFGLGNALVDTEVNVEEAFLVDNQIAKSLMTLIETERMTDLAQKLEEKPHTRCSGGSAANTIFAVQGFGGKAAFTGKVAKDGVGDFFLEELSQAGIGVNRNAQVEEGRSGQCFIMITPDAERTMNTDLGASRTLGQENVPIDAVEQSTWCYIEGYLCAQPDSVEAAVLCRETAEQAGKKTALTLSDPSMVEMFRDNLEKMLGNGINMIFCNEEEALAWAKTDRLDIAINELKDVAPELFVTLGPQGSIAVDSSGPHAAAGIKIDAKDATGAGDIYAGAAFSALLQGASAIDAAQFANHCAAHIVARYGARLKTLEEYVALANSYTR